MGSLCRDAACRRGSVGCSRDIHSEARSGGQVFLPIRRKRAAGRLLSFRRTRGIGMSALPRSWSFRCPHRFASWVRRTCCCGREKPGSGWIARRRPTTLLWCSEQTCGNPGRGSERYRIRRFANWLRWLKWRWVARSEVVEQLRKRSSMNYRIRAK